MDIRNNDVQPQPTVTRTETGRLSAYLSGTESPLPSTPPFLQMRNRYHRKYVSKRGATSQISEWKSRNTNHNLLVHSLGLLPGHWNRDECEVYQVPRFCPKSQRLQSICRTAQRTQVLTKHKHAAMLKSSCASLFKPFLKHLAQGRYSEQAMLGQPGKNSAATSNWQWFYNRMCWGNPTAGSTAKPFLLSLPVTHHQKRNRGISQHLLVWSLASTPYPHGHICAQAAPTGVTRRDGYHTQTSRAIISFWWSGRHWQQRDLHFPMFPQDFYPLDKLPATYFSSNLLYYVGFDTKEGSIIFIFPPFLSFTFFFKYRRVCHRKKKWLKFLWQNFFKKFYKVTAFYCFVIVNHIVLARLPNTYFNLKFKTVNEQNTSKLSPLSALCLHVDETELFQDRNAGKNHLIF